MKQFSVRQKRTAAGITACALAVSLALFFSGFRHETVKVDTLGGKWVGNVVWNDVSERPYKQTMRTAVFFLPYNRAGIVLTFPTGAMGGSGTYALSGSRLTVHCTSLSVNGRALPPSTFSHAPWYRDAAAYTVSYNQGNLTLTPAEPGPTPAPCWPLLVSPKPLVLSRREPPAQETPAVPAPRE